MEEASLHANPQLDLGLDVFDTPASSLGTAEATPAAAPFSNVSLRSARAPAPASRRSKPMRTATPHQVTNIEDLLGNETQRPRPPLPATTHALGPTPGIILEAPSQVEPATPVDLASKPIEQLTPTEREERFNIAMAELRYLKEKGCLPSRGFGYESKLEDLEREVKRLKGQRKKDLWVRDMNKLTVGLASWSERLNRMWNPFGLDLDGFGENILGNMEEFEEIHRELYDKYLTEVDYPPEMRWAKAFIFGAISYSNERARIREENATQPKIQDELAETLNHRPDLLAQIEQAAAEVREQKMMGMHSMPLRASPPVPTVQEHTIPFPPEAYRGAPTREAPTRGATHYEPTTPGPHGLRHGAPPATTSRRRRKRTATPTRRPQQDTDDEGPEVQLRGAPHSTDPQLQEINMSEAESLTDLLT